MQKKYAGGIFLAQSGRKWITFSAWPTGRTPWGEESSEKKEAVKNTAFGGSGGIRSAMKLIQVAVPPSRRVLKTIH